jgi:hypothetical protein
MLDESKINKMIEETTIQSEETRRVFGKEIYQKRFKPVYEGYLTALCTVLEMEDDEKTNIIKSYRK